MSADCAQSIPDLPAITCEWPIGAMGTRPLFAGACLIDVQGSAIEFLAIERSHGGVRLGLVTHGDEGKSARLSSHAVHHQRDLADDLPCNEQNRSNPIRRHSRLSLPKDNNEGENRMLSYGTRSVSFYRRHQLTVAVPGGSTTTLRPSNWTKVKLFSESQS